MQQYKNLIGGEWVDSSNGETFENRNPANHDEVLGTFPLATEEDVARAIAAANEAKREWGEMPPPAPHGRRRVVRGLEPGHVLLGGRGQPPWSACRRWGRRRGTATTPRVRHGPVL